METAEFFKNRKAALVWLQQEGYKISQGKFYTDCKTGNPPLTSDGRVSKYQTMLYGQKLIAAVEPDQPMSSREDDMRKAKADADMAEMKALKMKREQDGMWLYAADAWAEMAAIIGTLRDTVRHHLYAGQEKIIITSAGEMDRSQEVFELVDEFVSRGFSEVAGQKIAITFEREVE